MTFVTFGDMARHLVSQARAAELRTEISALTGELASGRTSDPAARLQGDYSGIADIEGGLARLASYRTATAEAGLFASGVQAHLQKINASVDILAAALISLGSYGQTTNLTEASRQAGSELEVLVSGLNGHVGGRSLFSGIGTDRAPLSEAQDILADLATVVAGQTTAVGVRQAAADWFDDPAGFRAGHYAGSDTALEPMTLADGQAARFGIMADDPAFRAALRDTALAALATDPGLGLDPTEQAALLKQTGLELVNTREDLVRLQAATGETEARIEAAGIANEARRVSLQHARSDLLGADPYDVATRLEAAQFRLESLYAATVRSARLSLVGFLR